MATGVAMVIGASSTAWAQVPFRITLPANGASVRETVRLQMPRTALSGVQYLTLTIDGKFRSGVDVPPAGKVVRTNNIESNASIVSLVWNTKALSKTAGTSEELVADGAHTLEITAYNAAGKPVGSQTLTLNVNNKGQLPSPAGGVLLSYSLHVGDQAKYRQKTEVEYISDPATNPQNSAPRNFNGFGAGGGMTMGGGGGPAMMGGGGRPGGGMMMGGGGRPGGRGGGMPMGGGGMGPNGGGYTPTPQPTGPVAIPVQDVTANYERTVEDIDGNAFLMRDKTVDGVIVSGNGAAARLEDVYAFKSRYRSVLPSGYVEQFIPASVARPGAYVALPLIDLGGVRRRVGEQWTVKAPVLLEWATLNKPPMVDTKNTLESLEWQNGFQTARIVQTYTGKANMPIFGGAGEMRNADVKMTRIIWFAYGSRRVIRTETQTEVSGNAPASIVQQMVPAAGSGGISSGLGGRGGGGGMMMGGGGGMMAAGGGGMMAGGDEGGAGMMLGGPGAGFGAQGSAEEALVPAKFRSNTVVTLNTEKPAAKKTVVIIKSRKK